jgi:hypothetical protein
MSEINISNVSPRRAMETLQTDVQFVELLPDAGDLEGMEGSLPLVLAKCRKELTLGANDVVVVVGVKVEPSTGRRSAAKRAPQFRYQTFRVSALRSSSGLSMDSNAVVPWVVQKVEVTRHEECLAQEETFLREYAKIQESAVANQTRKALMAHLEDSGTGRDIQALLGSTAFPEGAPVSGSVAGKARPAFDEAEEVGVATRD